MRAVNLVPPESRAGRVSGGKSGGAVYGVVGGLAVLVLMACALAMVKRDKAQAEQELATVQQSTQAFEQAANQFSSFESAATAAQERITLVRSLADARFDWAGTLRDMSRLIPAQTQIYTLDASVKDGVGAGGGGSSTFRTQLGDVPAITLKGCTRSQNTVADLVTRLQAMRRVENVTLEQSTTDGEITDFNKKIKSMDELNSSSGSGGGSSASSDSSEACSLPSPYYEFTVTVFYAPGKALPAAAAISAAPASGAATIGTETAGATTPAPTATPAGN